MAHMSEERSYRLERWIAVLLFLLFFLPFVANADEILFTDLFHGDEVKAKSGEHFLALVYSEDERRCVLQPVKIQVSAEYDAVVDAENERTGKRVSVPGLEMSYLLRSERLTAGPVTCARPATADLLPISKPQQFTLGATKYVLHYRCGSAPDPEGFVDCALVLDANGVSQVLASFPALNENGGINSLDAEQYVAFAGDLDHDGKLDLLANISSHYNVWQPALFLSTAAKNGELVAKVAELVTTGC
jgi:hypothetical protein